MKQDSVRASTESEINYGLEDAPGRRTDQAKLNLP